MKIKTKTVMLSTIIMMYISFWSGAYAQSQLKNWFIAPKSINFTTGPPTLSTLQGNPPFGSGGSYYGDNSTAFYIANASVYSIFGGLIGSLGIAGNPAANEYVIAPSPENGNQDPNDRCISKYFIIVFDVGCCGNQSLYLRYYTLDMLAGTLSPPTTLNTYASGSLAGGLALGRLKNGVRQLYAIAGGKIDRYTISASGVSAATTINNSLPFNAYRTAEADISDNGLKLAWGEYLSNQIHIVTLNSAGNYVSHTQYSIGGSSAFHGVEFNANATRLFVGTGSTGIYSALVYNGVASAVSGSASYGNSQLERAYNGLIYAASSTDIKGIDPNTNSFSGSALSLYAPSNSGFFLLPDQIDGQDYSHIPLESDFDISISGIGGSGAPFVVTATCNPLPPSDAYFWWEISELNTSTGQVIPGTTLTNPQQWWYTPISTTFPGYCCTNNPGPMSGNGYFYKDRLYRITRGVWGWCSGWVQTTKTVFVCGASCTERGINPGEEVVVEYDHTYRADPPETMVGIPTSAQQEFNFRLFPNPSSGNMQFSYNLQEGQTATFTIMDMTGKQVSSYNLVHGESLLDIHEPGLSPGIYLYRVIIDGKVFRTDRFSITR